jgi:hypothetical protein
VRQRLELLAKICDAVQHAHHNGIIHRDLKPTNILVNERGEPKILDFGVARAIDRDLHGPTVHTETGQLVGTLPYMSPEQVAGDLHEIDTRSDVYALGVIAFELLTERLPYSLAERSLPEAIRIIREEDASRLSSVDRSLRGDVETIVAKALEKEKDRRYGGAGEFSADIGRYLNYEPISARPPSAWYQLGKFARRNKVLVGGIGAVCLALLCGIIATSHQAIRAERQRQIAERALEESDQFIAMFIAGLIRQGNFDTAVEYQRNSWQSNTRSLGPDHKLTLKSQLSLADLVSRTDAPWALELVRDAAVRSTHAFGKDDTLTLRAGISLCNLLTNTGHLQEAAEVARDVWQRASRSGRTVEAIEAESMLAFALSKLGSDEAEGLLRNLVTDARRGTGPRSFYTLGAMNSFASYLLDHERWREALPVAQELYEAMCQSHSAPEGEVPGYIALYGIVLVKLERFADADAVDAPELDVALLRVARPVVALPHLDGASGGDVHRVAVRARRRGERLEADDLPGARDVRGADLLAVAERLAPHLGGVGAPGHGLERKPAVRVADLDREVTDREIAEEEHLAGLHEGLAHGRLVGGELGPHRRGPAGAVLPVRHVEDRLRESAALTGLEYAPVACARVRGQTGREVDRGIGGARRLRRDTERRCHTRCEQRGGKVRDG